VAIIMMIFAASIIIDNPNNRNVIPIIATIVLGLASIPILLGTIHPIIAILLLGVIGFGIVVFIQTLLKLRGWLPALLMFSLVILIVLNTLGLIFWSTGHVEGYF